MQKEILGANTWLCGYVCGLLTRVHACAAYIDCKNDKTSNITLELVDNSPFHLKGTFIGPEDTPYEGGHYDVVSTVCISTL